MKSRAMHRSRVYVLGVYVLGLAFVFVAAPAAALDPALKCELGKIKEAGKYSSCLAKAESKARKKGLVPDFTSCDDKLETKYTKLEAKGACAVDGNESRVEDVLADSFDAAVALVDGSLAQCGNGVLDPGEECDSALPDPFPGLACDLTLCTYNFSAVYQTYCNGSCALGGVDCAQADADQFCQLRTGNPSSTAVSWGTTTALPMPGIACPANTGSVNLGQFPERGVNVDVWYEANDVLDTHGPGDVIIDAVCTP